MPPEGGTRGACRTSGSEEKRRGEADAPNVGCRQTALTHPTSASQYMYLPPRRGDGAARMRRRQGTERWDRRCLSIQMYLSMHSARRGTSTAQSARDRHICCAVSTHLTSRQRQSRGALQNRLPSRLPIAARVAGPRRTRRAALRGDGDTSLCNSKSLGSAGTWSRLSVPGLASKYGYFRDPAFGPGYRCVHTSSLPHLAQLPSTTIASTAALSHQPSVPPFPPRLRSG